MIKGYKLLGTEVIYENGPFKKVREYYAGYHPELGRRHAGWSGVETVVERELVTPSNVFVVEEAKCASSFTTR